MNGAAHGDAPSGDRERGDGRSRLANPLASRLSRALEAEQARWLAPLRSRLLRRVDIARRRRVLDLGAGGGTVAEELARRAAGPVVAVDVVAGEPDEADASADAARAVARVTADAVRLPFADGSFELAFCQAALLWMPLAAAAAELRRVVADTGAVLAIEPDFGGMIEHPEGAGLAQVWRAALSRAGADPLVGRKLPGALTAAGFDVQVHLVPELEPAAPARFAMLAGLPLEADESRKVADALKQAAESTAGAAAVVHLPWFCVTAKPRA